MGAARFDPQTEVGGVRIVALNTDNANQRDVLYDVVCSRCGYRMALNHEYIRQRARRGIVGCRKCNQPGSRANTLPLEPEGARDLRGQFWPRMTGRNGMRLGLGPERSEWRDDTLRTRGDKPCC